MNAKPDWSAGKRERTVGAVELQSRLIIDRVLEGQGPRERCVDGAAGVDQLAEGCAGNVVELKCAAIDRRRENMLAVCRIDC